MATISLNIKVNGGPRTDIVVTCCGTAVNEKTIKFKNGETISETDLVRWIERNLYIVLKEIQNKNV